MFFKKKKPLFQVKNLRDLYLSSSQKAGLESKLENKIEAWRSFIIDGKKGFVFASNEDKNKYFTLAKENIRKLVAKKEKHLRPKFRLANFFLGDEARISRICRSMRTKLNFEFVDKDPYEELPLRLIDLDYDKVTFELLFESKGPVSEKINTEIKIIGFDENGALLGENVDYLLPLASLRRSLKKIYIPNASKDAYKFEIYIKFAKNISI